MKGVTARLAESVLAVEYDAMPASATQKTKEMLLDSIGCALGGYVTERAKIAIQLGEAFGSKPEATVIGYKKLSMPAASFVNGELINCLDFDAVGPLLGHVLPATIPPTLAIAERIEANGKDVLTALAVAIEVANRVGGAVSGLRWPKATPPYYEEADRSSNSSAIFGSVAGACKLLRMSEEQMCGAMGIGGTTTPIPGNVKWEYSANANLKYGCWTGWMAMLGTVATLATQNGFRGDGTVLDGEHGYWKMYGSPFFREELVLGDFGKVWHLEQIAFKAYPACQISHTAIEGIKLLVRENGIKPEDIDEILVYADPMQLTPNRWPAEIVTEEDAQFADAYLYALAACYEGKPGPSWNMPSCLQDPTVKSLMPKVKVQPDPNIEEILAAKAKAGGVTVNNGAIVVIVVKGRRYTKEVPAPKGTPANPIRVAELEDKFRLNASYSLIRRDRVEQIIDAVWNLERLDNIARLTRLLCIGD